LKIKSEELEMRFKRLGISLLFLSILFLIFAIPSFATKEKVIQARIYLTPLIKMQDLLPLQLDIIYLKPGEYFDFITNAKQVEDLREEGLEIEIIHEDLVAFYRLGLDTSRDMGGYHTFEETGNFLDSMHNQYSGITTDTISIGYSWEDRSIWAFKISDNPELDEDEPEILYTGLHHAREPMSIEVLIYFITHVLENYGVDPEITEIVDNTELWFIPILNPDGYEYNRQTDPGGGGMWRKNRRDNGNGTFGVDLNRNYDFKWGYDDIGSSPNTSSETYRGPAPFSEPETQVIRDFVLAHDFVACINYHSVAELFLYPWGYTYYQPTDFLVDWAFGDSASFYTGYVAIPGCAFYLTNGGSDDWHRGEQTLKTKVFGYTSELGRYSFWPPPELIGPVCQENLEANKFYARMAQRLYDHSIRFIETDPNLYYFYTSMAEDSIITMDLRIYNHDASSVMYYNITTPDSSEAALAELLRLTQKQDKEVNGFFEPLASAYDFIPSSFGKVSNPVADWLRVDPSSGTISPDSYQDFTITIDGTVIEGDYFGKRYDGGIVIATSNDRTPLYCDTSFMAVDLDLHFDYYNQYSSISTDELVTSISNNTNVGGWNNTGMEYHQGQYNFLNEGSFFAGYISDQGDTIIHREIFNTHAMRATSHLDLDSISDPRGTHAYFTTNTGEEDLEIVGDVMAPSHPDSSEFFILKYKVHNTSGVPINSLFLGMMMDWNVIDLMNGSGSDASLNLIWQYKYSNYAGLAYLSQDSAHGARAIDNDIYVWPQDDFLTHNLYQFISFQGFLAFLQGKDITSILSARKMDLEVDDSVEVDFVLVVSEDGEEGLKENVIKARIFAGVAVEHGDVNNDGVVEVTDVVFLINYLFKNGPAPDPLYMGDANCDSTVEVTDVVYLINYLFKNGPSPCIQ
jgi:hypothetical protein